MGILLTIKEAAVRLRVSVAMVYLLCSRGPLPHVRFGLGRGTIRIREEDLTAFIEGCKVEGGRPTNAAGLKHLKAPTAGSP
jgi:excisionase family DNA binding protein